MLKILLRLLARLSPKRKRQFAALGFLTLIGGIIEAISLGAILPFLTALADPAKILSYPLVSSLFLFVEKTAFFFGFSFPQSLWLQSGSIVLATAFALAAICSTIIRLGLIWLSLRVAYAAGAEISQELYRRTLYQPYSFHISQNSSKIIGDVVLREKSVASTLSGWLSMVTASFLASCLIICLFLINFSVAAIATLGLAFSYGMVIRCTKAVIFQNSLIISREQTQVIKVLQESLGGIRDILLDATQPLYFQIYKKADTPMRRAVASNSFASQSPRYIMEVISICFFIGLALTINKKNDAMATAIPFLGALALAAQRLLPTLQQIYSAWSMILGSQASTVEVLESLERPMMANISKPLLEKFLFERCILFESVGFRYTQTSPWVFENLTFEIQKGSRVGFVGKTGAGKSTCLDLLMGLLEPSQGRILIDGKTLNNEILNSWQRIIAHVPQTIFLSDASLAENIAFGIPAGQIDMDRVRFAAQQAQIANFIQSSPKGYGALVGERGIRLSGGQRQRIGIARALYKQAQLLVFDEATSALDHETEDTVIQSVNTLCPDLTILMIAHRTSTLKNCGKIISLDQNSNYP